MRQQQYICNALARRNVAVVVDKGCIDPWMAIEIVLLALSAHPRDIPFYPKAHVIVHFQRGKTITDSKRLDSTGTFNTGRNVWTWKPDDGGKPVHAKTLIEIAVGAGRLSGRAYGERFRRRWWVADRVEAVVHEFSHFCRARRGGRFDDLGRRHRTRPHEAEAHSDTRLLLATLLCNRNYRRRLDVAARRASPKLWRGW